MSAELSKIQARVSVQERQALETAVRLEEVSQNVETLVEQVAELKAGIATFSENVDHQFKQVYGELADMNANMAEMRNLLATLVARSEK